MRAITKTVAGVALIFFFANCAFAEMVVTAKDGRKFTLPLNSGDIRQIEYNDGTEQSGFSYGQDIAGAYNWVAGQTLVIKANNSLEVFDASGKKINDGSWELLDATQRRYRFTHRLGGWVDTVTLSPDSRYLDGTNNHGNSLHGSRR